MHHTAWHLRASASRTCPAFNAAYLIRRVFWTDDRGLPVVQSAFRGPCRAVRRWVLQQRGGVSVSAARSCCIDAARATHPCDICELLVDSLDARSHVYRSNIVDSAPRPAPGALSAPVFRPCREQVLRRGVLALRWAVVHYSRRAGSANSTHALNPTFIFKIADYSAEKH